MSDRISEILEVIRETVPQVNRGSSLAQFRDARISATKRVAERRRIARETVQDKYGRQLRPDVGTVGVFDGLMREWFGRGDTRLRQVLEKHAIDASDDDAIREAFHRYS